MHRDDRTSGLESAHAIPKRRIGLIAYQFGVLVVWNDPKDGADLMSLTYLAEALEPLFRHRRAEIVETQ